MYKPKVRIQRHIAAGQAMCQECGWTSECTRSRARVHAAEKRHAVDFIVPHVTVYEPLEADRG